MIPTGSSLDRGNHAEDACCAWLKKQGLKLLTRNYHSRRGELDLVMQDGKTVVFIEVRYRKNDLYGGALESVTPAKQQKLRATAEQYLQQETRLLNGRFDVVAMTPATNIGKTARTENAYTFNWIKNAF
jgi:putative endonuclease